MLLFCLLGFIAGALVLYLVLKPRLKTTQTADLQTAEENQRLLTQKAELEARREEILKSISELEKQAEAYYSKNLELATEKLDTALEKVSLEYQSNENEYRVEYLSILDECANNFTNELSSKRAELEKLNSELENLRSAVEAGVEASKRAAEMEAQQDFYRLNLSDIDIEEIKKLREVLPYLRDKEPLNKVIYKVYYEKPYTDLVGRVIGSAAKTGIYKITNLTNGMCYVGQAANVAERWRQHIKRGVGAEAPTRNKLYPEMYKIGVENFTFELIEECDRSRLDEREDYWQDYFKAKEFGYSIK